MYNYSDIDLINLIEYIFENWFIKNNEPLNPNILLNCYSFGKCLEDIGYKGWGNKEPIKFKLHSNSHHPKICVHIATININENNIEVYISYNNNSLIYYISGSYYARG